MLFRSQKIKQHKSVGFFIVCRFLLSQSWRDKWHVSWFNDFIGRLSSETKPRPKSWPTLSIVWRRLKTSCPCVPATFRWYAVHDGHSRRSDGKFTKERTKLSQNNGKNPDVWKSARQFNAYQQFRSPIFFSCINKALEILKKRNLWTLIGWMRPTDPDEVEHQRSDEHLVQVYVRIVENILHPDRTL